MKKIVTYDGNNIKNVTWSGSTSNPLVYAVVRMLMGAGRHGFNVKLPKPVARLIIKRAS